MSLSNLKLCSILWHKLCNGSYVRSLSKHFCDIDQRKSNKKPPGCHRQSVKRINDCFTRLPETFEVLYKDTL